MIRSACRADLPHVVAAHMEAFGGSLETTLGSRFLSSYYRLIMRYPRSIVLVAEEAGAGGPVGFAAGFLDPARFYSYVRSRTVSILPAVVTGLIRRPRLLRRVIRGYGAVARSVARYEDAACELALIGVRPGCAGRGLGSALVAAFVDASRELGAAGVYVHTAADNNERANRFYQRLGFALRREDALDPRLPMNEYYLGLSQQACPSCDETADRLRGDVTAGRQQRAESPLTLGGGRDIMHIAGLDGAAKSAVPPGREGCFRAPVGAGGGPGSGGAGRVP